MGRQTSGSRRAVALLLILLGMSCLLFQFNILSLSMLGVLWPFFVIIPGLMLLYFAYTGSEEVASLAIPGALIAGTGAILLVQSMTGRWASWAYTWALYPVFLGLGLMFQSNRSGNRRTYATGRSFVRWGLILFLIFGAFFEGLVFNDLPVAQFILPMLLIGAGLYMLLRRPQPASAPRKRQPNADDDAPLFTGAPVTGKRPTGYAPSASDALRRQIDLALAEDDEAPPTEE